MKNTNRSSQAGRVRIDLTPAQARTVNDALAYLETDAEYDGALGVPLGLVRRTRTAVHNALWEAGVQP